MGYIRNFAILALILCLSLSAQAAELLSYGEFRSLEAEIAPRVNLFRDVWTKLPDAVFYGGTSRDFTYWLKGQFRGLTTRAQVDAEIQKLRALPLIDVRDFISPDSDVDIVSTGSARISAQDYGVKAIDLRDTNVFDPKTAEGENELLQGYIPAEKIRLGRKGIIDSNFGDGVREIFDGKLTVHFSTPEEFRASYYAQQKLNHPILLALRYLRLNAANYFQNYGQGYPDTNKLFDLDSASAAEVKKVIASASDGRALREYLANPPFQNWINGTIQKAFRSYTNPTAAFLLMQKFGADRLPNLYAGIEPINQYLFAKARDPSLIEENLKRYGVNRDRFFTPVEQFFPDGKFYHGTKTLDAFQNILLQGVLPSSDGGAGAGLYGVDLRNREFAEKWGRKDLLLSFTVKPDAKIVDITQGEGKRVFDAYGHSYDAFADAFGIDALYYPYTVPAYVFKNSAALSKPDGVYRQAKTLSKVVEEAEHVSSLEGLRAFLTSAETMPKITTAEGQTLLSALNRSGAPISELHPDELTGSNGLTALLKQPYVDAAYRLVDDIHSADDVKKAVHHLESYPQWFFDRKEVLSKLRSNPKVVGLLSASPELYRELAAQSSLVSSLKIELSKNEFEKKLDEAQSPDEFRHVFETLKFYDQTQALRPGIPAPAFSNQAAVDKFLSRPPKDWFEPFAGDTRRLNCDIIYFFTENLISNPLFAKDPRAPQWLEEFTDLLLDHLGTWRGRYNGYTFSHSSGDSDRVILDSIFELLKYSRAFQREAGTRILEKLLVSGPLAYDPSWGTPSEFIDRKLRELMNSEPWKNNRLQPIWEEVLATPRLTQKNRLKLRKKNRAEVYQSKVYPESFGRCLMRQFKQLTE